MGRILSVVFAICIALLVVGSGLVVAALPTTATALSARHSLGEAAGLTSEETRAVVSDVWGFVVLGSPDLLPRTVSGRPGFDEAAVSHLVDVRVVLRATAGAYFLAALGAWGTGRALGRRDTAALRRALRTGAVAPLVAVAAVALWAAADFGSFFTAFHGVFFADGTWTFPSDSLLILCFPQPFWVSMGVVWATGSAAVAVATIAASTIHARRTHDSRGGRA